MAEEGLVQEARARHPLRVPGSPALQQQREIGHVLRPALGVLEHGRRRTPAEDRDGDAIKHAPSHRISHEDSG